MKHRRFLQIILGSVLLFAACTDKGKTPDQESLSNVPLPEIQQIKLPKNNFPTLWQSVLFRNYGYVAPDRLAKVLGCSKSTIQKEAKRLGLEDIQYDKDWKEKGYITLIRNNWFLLPYDQLCTLIDFTPEKLAFVLKEEDFLSAKLNFRKPECASVVYSPLTEEQEAETEKIASFLKPYMKPECKAFDFFARKNRNIPNHEAPKANGLRMLHGYLTSCGDVFAKDSREYLPDELLEMYESVGVNALWAHGQLSKLSPYPFDESLSEGYELRQKNLKSLIKRCKKHGIRIYLYLNEPRALTVDKFVGEYADLKGHQSGEYADLCLKKEKSREYLYNTVKDLAVEMEDLGGIFTITMSENATHCLSGGKTNCPNCTSTPPEEMAAEVNNIMCKALRDSGTGAEMIANLWGWAHYMGWSDEQIEHGIDLLDKDITVLCVSEFDLALEKGGIKSNLIDYSISCPGPSEITKTMLGWAKEKGHKIVAKIQVNNSWELSSVPYLPVFDLAAEHMRNLREIGVRDFMLTWTQGGYPSPMLDMVGSYDNDDFDIEQWYASYYDNEGPQVHEAVKLFCDAFQKFPFHVGVLYNSPKNLGMANMWDLEPDGWHTAMTSYTSDDLSWLGPYPYDVYVSCFESMLEEWEQGLEKLKDLSLPQSQELTLMAEMSYQLFKADLLHTRYSLYKRDIAQNKEALQQVIEQAKECTERSLSLMRKDARIGFEAANHYFYTSRNLLEKRLQLQRMAEELQNTHPKESQE